MAADHAGYSLKDTLAKHLADRGIVVIDLGTNGPERVDYPDYGVAVAEAVSSGDADLGVAVCGSGIGIGIAANKVPAIRAATVHDETSARLSRQHNDSNVLCLGERLIGVEVAAGGTRRLVRTPASRVVGTRAGSTSSTPSPAPSLKFRIRPVTRPERTNEGEPHAVAHRT